VSARSEPTTGCTRRRSAISLSWWVCAFQPGLALNSSLRSGTQSDPTISSSLRSQLAIVITSSNSLLQGSGMPNHYADDLHQQWPSTRERRTVKPYLYRSVCKFLHVDSRSRQREPHLGWTDSSCSISGGYQARARVRTRRAPCPSRGRAFGLRAAYATTAKADESQG
jgi:hypothetical protein